MGLARTPAGLRIRRWGCPPHAALAGIPVERTLLQVALASGAIAGVAGAVLVAGIQHRLTSGIARIPSGTPASWSRCWVN
ncbi:MAG: hypothetical protein R3C32_12975 [Chloroflexota bacterium]